MYIAEQTFVNTVSKLDGVNIFFNSHRSLPYDGTIMYLRNASKDSGQIQVAYEVKLNNDVDKFPDFLLINNDKSLRIEIKEHTREQTIAKEINSLHNIIEDEFWYIIFGNKDLNKINNYSMKADKKIKVMRFDENILIKISKFFQI
jgi:hypothetical protein